jgi:hypothetical protein
MSTPKSAVVYLNDRLVSTISEQQVNFSSVGLDVSGAYIPTVSANYIASASNVQNAISILDSKLYSVATTYASREYVDQQISSLKANAPSTLDTLAEIAASLGGISSFSAAYVSSITGIYNIAVNAENTISTNIVNETTRATNAESTIIGNLNSESTRAQASESTLTSSLSGENVRALLAEDNLLSSIQYQTSVRSQLMTNLESFVTTTIADLSGNVRSALSTETARAISAEQTISTSVATEILRATDAESTIRGNLNTEIARATGAEQTISTSIVNEYIRASTIEAALSGRTTGIETTLINKDGSVAFTGQVDAGNNKIIDVINPTNAGDLANKYYVDNGIATLGAVFEYISTVNIAVTTNLNDLVQKSAGDVYKVVGTGNVSTTTSSGKFVKDGDFVVRNLAADDWDILNNKDITINGTTNRIVLSGNAFDEYIVNISPNYVGQASINTVGTVTNGIWQGSVISTLYGGLGFSSYATGDLLMGNSATTLSKLAIGSSNTMLKSDGLNSSWVAGTTGNFSITDTTNFSTLSTVQQSLDYLYDSYQKRKVVQFVISNSSSYTDPVNYNADLLSGKANFINYHSSISTIYLPPTSANLVDNTVVRIIHNGTYGDNNMRVAYKHVGSNAIIDVVEAAPHDTMVLIYKSTTTEWLAGVGI